MKVALEVFGLSAAPASSGAFALILKEVEGDRRLPIVIGQPEAAAIGYELEGMKPTRPMTHDLLKSAIEALNGQVSEVLIHDLREGTFFASIIIDGAASDVDARPSDAIALAVRCNVPIYILENLMDEAGYEPGSEEIEDAFETPLAAAANSSEQFMEKEQPEGSSLAAGLMEQLQKAILQENYEQAAKLRDQLEKLRKEGSS
jgi:bifunctional DNase/RNase